MILVEVMNFARRLLGRLVEHPYLLNAIDDHHFEELVATLLSDLGLKDVELTPRVRTEVKTSLPHTMTATETTLDS